jgi:hypothetical protein
VLRSQVGCFVVHLPLTRKVGRCLCAFSLPSGGLYKTGLSISRLIELARVRGYNSSVYACIIHCILTIADTVYWLPPLYKHTHTRAHTHTHLHTKHTSTHTRAHTHLHTHLHAHAHTYIHSSTHTHTHVHTHTHLHTYIYAPSHIYTHTHTQPNPNFLALA